MLDKFELKISFQCVQLLIVNDHKKNVVFKAKFMN